jgi:hypothetical protein
MIDITKMTLREQALVLITAVVIVGGAYGAFRFYPANKAIGEIKKNTEMMDAAIKTGKIPDEPFDDTDSLNDDIADLEIQLNDAKQMISGVEGRLSSSDTTDVRLAISEVARRAFVRISANEEYRVTVPPVAAVVGAKATAQPQKRLGDAAQRRARNERRAARATGGALRINQVSPDLATQLAKKMAINGPMERPMQRLVMEGTYAGMMRFIEGLEQLNYMVTIVQFQMAPTQQTPPPGLNQRLTATLVLAL